jgi:hypothetical protein
MAKRRVKRTSSKTERVHSVTAHLNNAALPKAMSALRLIISAKRGGEQYKLGELQVGRGGIYWWGHKRKKWLRLSWTNFANMLDDKAYKRRA